MPELKSCQINPEHGKTKSIVGLWPAKPREKIIYSECGKIIFQFIQTTYLGRFKILTNDKAC